MRIGFAGAGNMAAAIARGWVAGPGGPERLLFCDAGSGRARALADETGGEAVDSLGELARRSDAVVLAVKPAALEIAAERLGDDVEAVVSVLGATSLARLQELFAEATVLRLMPTVAVEVRRGVICHAPLERSDGVTGARLLELFNELGHLVELPDELIDAATAIMGCTPAYLALVVQVLAEAGEEAGIDREQAGELIVEAFDGTVELLRRYDPITVRTAVASPGGSTEAGLGALADHAVADGFRAAVAASLERMRP
jgi:pyrroline-5-carboxylate reductase